MNRIDLLLTHLSEECVETALRACKAVRYGLDDIQPGQPLTNGERVAEELLGLITTVAILESEGVLLMPRGEAVERRKKAKAKRILQHIETLQGRVSMNSHLAVKANDQQTLACSCE